MEFGYRILFRKHLSVTGMRSLDTLHVKFLIVNLNTHFLELLQKALKTLSSPILKQQQNLGPVYLTPLFNVWQNLIKFIRSSQKHSQDPRKDLRWRALLR